MKTLTEYLARRKGASEQVKRWALQYAMVRKYGKMPRDIPDMIFSRGEGVPKCDGHLLYGVLCGKQMRLAVGDERRTAYAGHVFDKSFMDELIERGYDITTLRFTVRKKAPQE